MQLAEGLDTRYAVTGFPTLKVFHGDADAETSVDYNGERVAGAIVEAMREYADPDWAPPQQAALTLTAVQRAAPNLLLVPVHLLLDTP